jgi:uncharacterized protein (DUF885 family)
MSTLHTRRTALQALAAAVALPCLPRISLATQSVSDSQRLRQLIATSEAATNALDPMPRIPPPPGSPVFVDPLGETAFDAVRSGAERDLAGLRSLHRAALPATEQIAYDVLEYGAEQQLARYRSGLAEVLRRVPLDATGGLHVGLPDYVSGAGAPFATPADYAAGLDRLRGFTGYLDSLVRQLKDGQRLGYHQPRVVVTKVIAQAESMLLLPVAETPFMAAVRRFPNGISAEQRDSFAEAYGRVVGQDVLPAYRRLAGFLQSDYLPHALDAPGRWAMKDGERLYASELQYHTTVDVTAGALHAIGLEEVARYRDGMEAVRGRVGFKGDLADFFDFIREHPQFYYTKPEDLLARFREIEQQIWIGMPRLFERRPRAPFEVRALPSIGEQRGTGYYRPGPPDGKSPGVLWFNMAMLGTRPIPTLETLTLHEGIPGHHYQITLAQEDASLPDNLRFGSLTAYSEGWGLYSESLGSELGLFTDPYQYFGHLDMGMLRAVRLVVDTGLHAGQWTRQKAIDYMLANTSMAQRDVEVEIDRYITRPAQACAYKTGELRIRALRDEAARNQGTGFDVKDFHGQVLDTGALPLAVLERKVRAWPASHRSTLSDTAHKGT